VAFGESAHLARQLRRRRLSWSVSGAVQIIADAADAARGWRRPGQWLYVRRPEIRGYSSARAGSEESELTAKSRRGVGALIFSASAASVRPLGAYKYWLGVVRSAAAARAVTGRTDLRTKGREFESRADWRPCWMSAGGGMRRAHCP